MKIDSNYVLNFMVDILKMPSPGGDTRIAMERVEKEFEAMGVKITWTKKRRSYWDNYR